MERRWEDKATTSLLAIVHAGVKPHLAFLNLNFIGQFPGKDDALLNNLEYVQGDEEDYSGGSSKCVIKIKNLNIKIQISTLVSALFYFFKISFSFGLIPNDFLYLSLSIVISV